MWFGPDEDDEENFDFDCDSEGEYLGQMEDYEHLQDYWDYMFDDSNCDDTTEGTDSCYERIGDLKYVSKAQAEQLKRCTVIMKNIRKLREDGLFCDAIIQVEDKEFNVNKNVLTSNTNYFEAMFTKPFTEQSQKKIELKGVSKDVFSQILNYFYGDLIVLGENNLQDVYTAADMFCVDSLISQCKEYFNQNWKSFKDFDFSLKMADLMNIQETFQETVREEFKNQYHVNFPDNSDCLLKVDADTFINFLSEDSYHITPDAERKVTEMIVKWMAHDPTEHIDHLLKVVESIRFNMLPYETINKFIQDIRSLLENNEKIHLFEKFQEATCAQKTRIQESIQELELSFQIFVDVSTETTQIDTCTFNLKEWVWIPNTFRAPFKPQLCLAGHSGFFLLGSTHIALYKPETNSCSKVISFQNAQREYSACISNGCLFIAGGTCERNGQHIESCTVHRLTIATKSWVKKKTITWQNPSRGCSITSDPANGRIYFIGGSISNNMIGEMEDSNLCYTLDPATRKIRKSGNLQHPIVTPKVIFYDSKLYVFPYELSIYGTKFPQVIDLRIKNAVSKDCFNDLKYVEIVDLLGVKDKGMLALLVPALPHQSSVRCLQLVHLTPPNTIKYIGFLPTPKCFEDWKNGESKDWGFMSSTKTQA